VRPHSAAILRGQPAHRMHPSSAYAVAAVYTHLREAPMGDKKKNTKIADLPKKAVSNKKASAVKGGANKYLSKR
jgi:hypothetical protein